MSELKKSTLFSQVKRGKFDFQVPEFEIIISEQPTQQELNDPDFNELVELEEDEYSFLKPAGIDKERLCFGQEEGFAHLNRKGYERFKEELKDRFFQAKEENGGRFRLYEPRTREEFDRKVYEWFDDIDENTRREQEKRRRKANQLLEQANTDRTM